MSDMHDLRKKLIALAALLVVFGIVGAISWMTAKAPTISPRPEQGLGEAIRTGTAEPPPFTDATRQKLEKSHGFQALVSYTDTGFEPLKVTIKKGNTVRFSDNSSRDLWVAAQGDLPGSLYPSQGSGCGSSAFDSCGPFKPQDFWEFTFAEPGSWKFVNNLDKTRTGTVIVVEVR